MLPLGVMALKCSVCQHVSRAAIELSLVHGEPMREVAGRYSISKSALHRHRNAHLPKALVKAQEAEEIVRADSLLGEMEVLIEHGHEILTEARAAGEHRTALSAMREIRGCLELLGKVCSAKSPARSTGPSMLPILARCLPYPTAAIPGSRSR